MKKLSAKKKIKKHLRPKKSGDVFATKSMLDNFRDELKSDITSVNLEVKSVRSDVKALDKRIDARFNEVDARFDKVDARFNEVDSRFHKVDSKLEQVISGIHRVTALVEEQNAQNRYVLDGYASLYDSQENIKVRLQKIEEKLP